MSAKVVGAGRQGPAEGGVDQSGEARRPARRRGHVTVFGNWCKGCGLCIAFCPQKVFEAGQDGLPIVAHEERCTACNWCYAHCPDFAILIEPVEDEDSRHPAKQTAEAAG